MIVNIVSTGAVTAKPTARCGGSLPPGCATTLPPKTTLPDARPKERTSGRSSAASNGTSPHRYTVSSPTRHQPRTVPAYATSVNTPVSPSARPPKPSEHIPAVSQPSKQAGTTTTTSPPNTRGGSEPANRPHHRFDNTLILVEV